MREDASAAGSDSRTPAKGANKGRQPRPFKSGTLWGLSGHWAAPAEARVAITAYML